MNSGWNVPENAEVWMRRSTRASKGHNRWKDYTFGAKSLKEKEFNPPNPNSYLSIKILTNIYITVPTLPRDKSLYRHTAARQGFIFSHQVGDLPILGKLYIRKWVSLNIPGSDINATKIERSGKEMADLIKESAMITNSPHYGTTFYAFLLATPEEYELFEILQQRDKTTRKRFAAKSAAQKKKMAEEEAIRRKKILGNQKEDAIIAEAAAILQRRKNL